MGIFIAAHAHHSCRHGGLHIGKIGRNARYILSHKRASLLGDPAIELVFDAQRLNNVGKGRPRNVKERKKGAEFAIFVNEFDGGKEMMSTSNHGLFAYEA